jgi:hypothetical protein
MLHCIQLEFYAPLENIIFTTHSMEKESQVQKKSCLLQEWGIRITRRVEPSTEY